LNPYVEARARYVRVKYNTMTRPPTGKRWLVIGGSVEHVTGTNTAISIRTQSADRGQGYVADIHADADSSQYSALVWFHKEGTTYHMAQLPHPVLIDDGQGMRLTGDATAYADIHVIEVPGP